MSDKIDNIYATEDYLNDVPSPACKACGQPFDSHPGVQILCKALELACRDLVSDGGPCANSSEYIEEAVEVLTDVHRNPPESTVESIDKKEM